MTPTTGIAMQSARLVVAILLVSGGRWLEAQNSQDMQLTVGKSIVLDYPADVERISTSNPDIVDASPVTKREVLVHGRAYGSATLVVWGKSGEKQFYNFTVEQNLDPLRRLIRESFPAQAIDVYGSHDSISLTGHVATKDIADRAGALAAPFAKTVVNNLSLDSHGVERQVILHVVFALLDRSMDKEFAVNLLSTGAGNTIGRIAPGGSSAPSVSTIGGTIGAPAAGTTTQFSISDALNIFAFRPDLNLGAFIKSLVTEQVLQILAQPNLVTSDGKDASFVVGGEFPVPILQGGANAGAITIEYHEFGVKLEFTPFITENQTIKLHVKPEVSSLDYTNAITLDGFTIPALATRKTETYVELGFGQSFVIAGLIDDRVTDSFTRMPGLASIPILGALFKSRSEIRSRTELIILVTPEITKPLMPGDPKPIPVMPQEFMKSLDPKALKQEQAAPQHHSHWWQGPPVDSAAGSH